VPDDYRRSYQFLGSVAIAADQGSGSLQIHTVYALPAAIAAYLKSGHFPDGAVLVKGVFETATAFGDEDAGVVDELVDAPEPPMRPLKIESPETLRHLRERGTSLISLDWCSSARVRSAPTIVQRSYWSGYFFKSNQPRVILLFDSVAGVWPG
jgi:hypothetical protein